MCLSTTICYTTFFNCDSWWSTRSCTSIQIGDLPGPKWMINWPPPIELGEVCKEERLGIHALVRVDARLANLDGGGYAVAH